MFDEIEEKYSATLHTHVKREKEIYDMMKIINK